MSTAMLAIIIPAYKRRFLSRTLDSIAAQSCQDFTLYIGDDASPEDLYSIVQPFEGKLSLRYHHFDENLGGKDLVAHWERCLRMTQNEQWVLLFSDDDTMPPDAVERFYAKMEVFPGKKFFRFPLSRIDENDGVEYPGDGLPNGIQSAEGMLLDYFEGKRPSAACEYVFARELFEQEAMIHFPLAWCSDVATWYRYASLSDGVVNIPGAPVCWRNVSNSNISNTSGLQGRKMRALIEFMCWLGKHYTGKRDRRFRRALYAYVKCNLSISFEGIFSRKDLISLTGALLCISPSVALRILFKYY